LGHFLLQISQKKHELLDEKLMCRNFARVDKIFQNNKKYLGFGQKANPFQIVLCHKCIIYLVH